MVTDGQRVVLGRVRDDVEEATQLDLAGERHGEELDRGVVDVVVGRNHAQVERTHVDLVLDRNALGLGQVRKRGLGPKNVFNNNKN